MTRTKLILYCLPLILASNISYSAEIDTNTARMQAMDKITGKVSVINVPVNGSVNFGTLSIVVRSCKTKPAEETPENFAFVDVADTSLKGEQYNIFKGWMLSSSPATHAVEHPIYDVWLLNCIDTKINNQQLLSEQQLIERDNLPMKARNVEFASTSSEKKKITVETPEIPEENTEQPTMEISSPLSEMEYEETIENEENSPEIIIETVSDNEEFSFDEEDDMSEIEAELERIKSDNKSVSPH